MNMGLCALGTILCLFVKGMYINNTSKSLNLLETLKRSRDE